MGYCTFNLTKLVLVMVQGGTILLLYHWYVPSHPQAAGSTSNGRVQVLLLSLWRSGSTFMGHMFEMHPSVFYIKEPLWYVWNKLYNSSLQPLEEEGGQLLHAQFHCNFSQLETSHKLRRKQFEFWSDNPAMCSPPVCPQMPLSQANNPTVCRRLCARSSTKDVETLCTNHSHLVFKVVRVFQLESFIPLFKDPGLNLRVIHLVRDPRAVFRSRDKLGERLMGGIRIILDQRKLSLSQAQMEVMEKICRSHLHINRRAVVDPPPFLKGRYKMVRYEDVVQNPLQEIKALYEFVGLTMTKELGDLIYTWTHGETQADPGGKTAFKASPRDAVQTSQEWRSSLDHDKVTFVQELCKRSMSLFRYKTVSSKEEQEDLDLDLVLPLDPAVRGEEPAAHWLWPLKAAEDQEPGLRAPQLTDQTEEA